MDLLLFSILVIGFCSFLSFFFYLCRSFPHSRGINRHYFGNRDCICAIFTWNKHKVMICVLLTVFRFFLLEFLYIFFSFENWHNLCETNSVSIWDAAIGNTRNAIDLFGCFLSLLVYCYICRIFINSNSITVCYRLEFILLL